MFNNNIKYIILTNWIKLEQKTKYLERGSNRDSDGLVLCVTQCCCCSDMIPNEEIISINCTVCPYSTLRFKWLDGRCNRIIYPGSYATRRDFLLFCLYGRKIYWVNKLTHIYMKTLLNIQSDILARNSFTVLWTLNKIWLFAFFLDCFLGF